MEEEKSCTLEKILYEMMWKNGHGGLRIEKIRRMGKERGMA